MTPSDLLSTERLQEPTETQFHGSDTFVLAALVGVVMETTRWTQTCPGQAGETAVSQSGSGSD